MVLLLVILFVFLFPSNGTSFETPEYSLDQTTLDISAEGTCTSGGVVCKDDLRDDSCTECTNATFLPQYAIDGDRNTEWVSMPSYENPSLTIDLGQAYNISSIEVLFKRPPLIWVLEYSDDDQSTQFTPLVAVVTQIEDCQNFTSYPECSLSQQITVDIGSSLIEPQLDDMSRPVASILKFTFIEPAESANQDPQEEFIAIQEIIVNVICEDALALFEDSDICPGIDRVYSPVIDIDVQENDTKGQQFTWLQTKQPVKPPLGTWYLDDVLMSGDNDSQLFVENFETDELNSSIWLVNRDAQIYSAPCTTDQVLLFSQPNALRGAILTGLPLQDLQSISFDLGFMDPTLQCVTDLGEVELSYCRDDSDECSLIKVFVLNDCGNCVNKHLLRLRLFASRLQMALTQLPSYSILIVANNTEFNIINNQVNELANNIEDMVFQLVNIERVHGLPSQYPRNRTLPTHIAAIVVSATNIELFAEYCEVVTNITQFTDIHIEVNEVSMLSNSLLLTATNIDNQIRSFQLDIEDLIGNLSSLFNQLQYYYNNVSLAVDNGNTSLALITARQYDDLESQISQLVVTSMEAGAMAVEISDVVEQHTMRIRNITDRLVLDREYLEAVINSSEAVINNTIDVLVINDEVEVILEEIKRQVSLASSLVTVIETNLFNAQQHSNTTKSIIDISNGVLDVTSDTVTVLQSLLLSLERQVEDYSTNLDRVSPVNYPSACLPGPTEVLSCLEGEIHSNSLEENSSRIVSESFATLLNANEFLASLADLPTIDFDDINRTATEAIVIGNNALTDLAQSDLNELISSVDQTRLDIDTLSVGVSSLLTDVRQTLLETEIQFNRSVNFENELAVIEDDFSVIKSGIVVVDNTRNYSIEAVDISNTMRMVHDTLDLVNTTIGNIEQDVSVVNETVMETVSVIEETEMILDYSEEQVLRVQDFLARTQQTLDQTSFGLNTTIQQNIDIISDIDALLSTVDATHDLLKRISSPATFQTSGSIQPYISLQPPPGVESINDTIQFNSLEIYLFADSDYNAPGILFYAGPLVEEGSLSNNSALIDEDYLAIVNQPDNVVTVEWRISQYSGSRSIAYTIADQKQLYLRRAGSMFELAAGFRDTAVDPVTNFTLIEGALLFKTTENTVFLIGGRPSGSMLAVTNHEIYGSLSGTLDLVLYNGVLWSLWDYRRRSNTEFIGTYNRHEAAQDNIFVLSSRSQASANILSFDGNGYLKPRQFIDEGVFDTDVINSFFIHYRLSSLEGLIMFLYDPETSTSIEAAVYDGQIQVLFNDGINIYKYTQTITNEDFNGGSLTIRFASDLIAIEDIVEDFVTFTDLTRVQAWFGGVILDELPATIRPSITTKRFRGCVDLIVNYGLGERNLFSQTDFFVENYLNSPVQKDVSATCFQSSYAQEVSFNGTDYLSYNLIEVAGRADGRPVDTEVPQLTLSLSFLPLQDNVMLFTAISGSNRMIVVEFINQMVQTTLISGSNEEVLRSTEAVPLNEWHHLILEIRTAGNSEGRGQSLFVDNSLVADTTALPGFIFPLSSTPSANPVLYVGGAPAGISTATTPFKGCLKHLIYNLDAINFFNPRLTSYVEKDGISFFECLFASDKMVSELSIVFSEPEVRGCGLMKPAEVLNDTIGGFHALSQVLSFNVLQIQSSIWSFQLTIRRYSHDGHVITFPSNDVTLSLFIEGGNIKWYLIGQLDNTSSIGSFISSHVWHHLQIDCVVLHSIVSCTNIINGTNTDIISHGISRDVFYPELPVVIGRDGEIRGFVGCLQNLQVNGMSLGYELEGLSTCEQCYTNPIDGWGFTGTGYLMTEVVSQSNPVEYHIAFSFKPRREHGLLLYVADDDPILGVGLYNGELRVTNFTNIGSFITLTNQLVCNSTIQLNSFHSISVDITQSSIIIALTIKGEQSSMTIQTVTMVTNQLRVYIGGLDGTSQDFSSFEFLLSGGGTALNSPVPRFIGCLQSVEVTAGTNTQNLLASVTSAEQYEGVLDGMCPN